MDTLSWCNYVYAFNFWNVMDNQCIFYGKNYSRMEFNHYNGIIFGGINMFALGVIGEYIRKIFIETKKDHSI